MKKVLKNPTVQSIFVGVVVTVVSTLIVSWVNSTSFLSSLKIIYLFIVKIISSILTFRIPVWVIILIIAVLIFFIYVYIRLQNNKQQVTIHSYIEDDIDNIRWVWGWHKGFDGKYNFNHDTPFPLCRNCSGELVVERNESYYNQNRIKCENCGFVKDIAQDFNTYHDKIKREIRRRIRLKFDNFI